MSSPLKKVRTYSNPLRYAMDKAGVSQSNFFRKKLDPLGGLSKSIENGGLQGGVDFIKSGELTDPDHAFHKTPDNTPIPAPPAASDGTGEGMRARDRIRRKVYRAQGRSSTIRAGSMNPYSGTQSQLLGS